MDLWKRNGTLNGLCPRCFGSFKHLQIRFLTSATFNNNLLSSNWLTWWLYQVNSQCDGDRDSYDAMILLTGRFDYHDVRPGLKIFLFSFGARPWGWWWYLILGWVQGVIILSVDIANLWKAVNRIRIRLREFGSTQIRISNYCRSKRKQVYGNLFRGLIGILTKMAKKWTFFVATPVTFLAKFWG